MKSFVFIALFLLVINQAKSQSDLTFKGKILFSIDSLPAFNVHIYFDGKGIGTTSNEKGGFSFHFPEELKENEIIISAIGFKPIYVNYSEVSNHPRIIYLVEDKRLLGEVIITAIEPHQILLKAINNLKRNYYQGQFSKEVYYKETFSINDKPIRYLEIVAEIEADGFSDKRKNPDSYEMFIKQKRPGFNVDSAFEGGNGIGVLHWLLWTERYFKKSNIKKFEIELVGKTNYKNEYVYKLKINLSGKNEAETYLYITQSTYAVVAINQKFVSKNKAYLILNRGLVF